MMPRLSVLLLALVLHAGALSAQVAAPQAPVQIAKPATPFLDLQSGDTLVFLGDSITHQSMYSQYVEDFFYTRYPDRKIRFHNAGVSGDQAADALARFDADVAPFKPKFVTILLGMNDGRYEDFSAETFALYQAGMKDILSRIQALGAKPIAMSPTLFDHHRLADELANNPEYRFRTRTFSGTYNALMAFYGAWLREESGANGIPFIDLYGPLNRLTESQRRTSPDFTLVPDAIHPDAAGQFVMAYELLQQLTPDRKSVSGITLTRAGAAWKPRASGGKVTGVEAGADAQSLKFTFLADSLPWVVPAVPSEAETAKWPSPSGARVGYQLTTAGHRLSNERLTIVGLEPGNYELKIDGEVVGKYPHAVLGAKIELQSNEKTPQYQQALRVALLNQERNDQAVRPSRDVWGRVKGLRRQHTAEGIPEKFAAAFAGLEPKIAELQALAAEYEAKIYAEAKPVPRLYELRRLP